MSMGHYAILVFTPALGATVIFHTVSYHFVHRWAFLLQMAWQTVCHVWMMYRQYYLEEIMTVEVFIMISSLMLLTQKITSLALDIHEKKVTVNIDEAKKNGLHHLSESSKLAVLSYLLFFPALLGGPLCSFVEFQKQISNCKVCDIRTVIKACTLFFFFHALQSILFAHITFPYDLTNCRRWECVCVMWSTALLFRLTYYSQWLLDEALLCSAGFYTGESSYADFTDGNILTLETTHRISCFARTWNKSTAKWLRRLIFQNCSKQPLLSTFAFSAWWHGLYPGQIFGFMCWALMVEADYRIHAKLSIISQSPIIRFLCKVITWLETQMIIAFIMLAVEMRSLTMLLALLLSFNSLFPFFYCVLLIFVVKIKA
ncbi:ghrelin O-acyltransferase isoform X2 [Dendrobates tinctorius]